MHSHLNRGCAFSPFFRPPPAHALSVRNRSQRCTERQIRIAREVLLFALLLLLPASALLAQEIGESVSRRGSVKEDIYLAGCNVYVAAEVDGDVIAAGCNVTVGDNIKGDALLAGGNVTIRGKMHDDVRAAGGSVTLEADVGDDALLAGGSVTLAPSTHVGGRGWFAGGRVDIAGRIGKELKAAGGRIVIAGEVMGDATLAGENIEIRPEAVIHGNLRYISPKEAVIDKAAKIEGTVTHLPAPTHEHGPTARVGARLGVFVSLMVTGIVLLLLFARAATAVTAQIALAPWKSLGLGLAVLTATPLVIVLLFASIIGVWLGFILLAGYVVALLGGFLAGALCTGETVLKRLRRQVEITRGWRVAALVITLTVVGVLGVVPLLCALVIFGMLLFGLGGVSLQIYRALATA